MQNQSEAISLPTLLLILFIGLKLTGYIDWSWLWVLSPIWIPLVLIAIILIPIGLYCLIYYLRHR